MIEQINASCSNSNRNAGNRQQDPLINNNALTVHVPSSQLVDSPQPETLNKYCMQCYCCQKPIHKPWYRDHYDVIVCWDCYKRNHEGNKTWCKSDERENKESKEDKRGFTIGITWTNDFDKWYQENIDRCIICSQEFQQFDPPAFGNKQRYCSRKCKIINFIKIRKERNTSNLKKSCLYCNKQFEAKRKDAKYCCASHRVLACTKRNRIITNGLL